LAPLPQLDPDEHGNAHLQRLVRSLHPSDFSPFVEKLTTQPLRERFHTYRELLLGAQIRRGGADFRYEQEIDGQTPDWSLVENGHLVELVDVVTLHQRNEKEREITTSIRSTNRWDGWFTIPPDHIYRKLNDKAGQYSALARRAQVPYVLAAFGEFLASISPEDVEHVLYMQHGGWFATTPEVSGIIYFREKDFRFEFFYFPNATANQPALWSSRITRWSEA
jgi:hypothetical protein